MQSLVRDVILRSTMGALFAVLLVGPLVAQTVATSPRPQARPAEIAEPVASATTVDTARAVQNLPKPKARPEGLATSAKPDAAPVVRATAAAIRPKPRPDRLVRISAPVDPVGVDSKDKKPKRDKTSVKGSVCGDPDIKGVNLARITSRVKGCGVQDPVSVASVDGIRLSQAATLDCATAKALKTWVQQSMRPAFGTRDVVQLQIAAHYICRPRNNIKGNKISEHGRGKAIDIAGFVFSDGTAWSVARNYNKQIRKAHKGACGIFGTTLGPGSDGYHEDHLHFDTASHRNGSYCR